MIEPWRTSIAQSSDGQIRLRGYDITELMTKCSFVDVLFLLHQNRLPSPHEGKLLTAIMIGGIDHGSGAPSCATARLAASGNRQSLSAAVAAGILAIGDEHGGAGALCMEMIGAGLGYVSAGASVADAAARIADEAKAAGRRLPGFGHRVHHADPRVPVLFGMAREDGAAHPAVAFVEALEGALGARASKPLPINIDGALAAILYDLGFPPAAGKLIFIAARAAGLTAEVAEEHTREKPMRIKVPVTYDGVGPRSIE